MAKAERCRVFLSHSTEDKEFVQELAEALRYLRIEVWYDDWEIMVGDSIVDKVFGGLRASDALVLVLSPSSVQSRWVREEMNVAIMRRLSEDSIRILPILIADCEVPAPLSHIRYADFRASYDAGLADLLDALSPGYMLWQSLAHSYEHLCLLCDGIGAKDLDEFSEDVLKITDLLESALDVRTEIEVRRARERVQHRNLFEKLGYLADKGVDVRSQTWNSFLYYRAGMAHRMVCEKSHLRMLAEILRKRYPTGDLRESLVLGLGRMKDIMRSICFDN